LPIAQCGTLIIGWRNLQVDAGRPAAVSLAQEFIKAAHVVCNRVKALVQKTTFRKRLTV
jgi:hypothetical protein